LGAGANDQQFRRVPKLPSYASGIAFYSTRDADTEGEEGKFSVWTPDQIREVLGDDGDDVVGAFIAAHGVTRHGNASAGSARGFEGKNILEFVSDMEQRPTLAEARHKLFEAREKRVHPGRDEGVLTSRTGHAQPRSIIRHCEGRLTAQSASSA
jgi:uncharacterized protein YyaL (SSP411 family)